MAKRPPVELNERTVQNALYAIGQPESWEELVRVGTAVKDALGDNGREMFVDWAKQSSYGTDSGRHHNFSRNFDGYDTSKSRAGTLIWLANDRTGGAFSRENAKDRDWKPSAEYLAKQAERRAAIEENNRREAEARAAKNADTVKLVQTWFSDRAMKALPSHPYLKRKDISDIPPQLTYYNGRIQIPIHDKDGRIIAAQTISGNPRGSEPEKMVHGLFAGGSFLIGDLAKAKDGVVMAEGFATAYSIHKATGLPVVMAVSSSNMANVAEVYKAKLPPGTPFVIAPDNDKNRAGLKAAEKAARVYGQDAVISMPQFDPQTVQAFQQRGQGTPSDYNDMALAVGYEAVRQNIQAALDEHRRQQQERTNPPDELERQSRETIGQLVAAGSMAAAAASIVQEMENRHQANDLQAYLFSSQKNQALQQAMQSFREHTPELPAEQQAELARALEAAAIGQRLNAAHAAFNPDFRQPLIEAGLTTPDNIATELHYNIGEQYHTEQTPGYVVESWRLADRYAAAVEALADDRSAAYDTLPAVQESAVMLAEWRQELHDLAERPEFRQPLIEAGLVNAEAPSPTPPPLEENRTMNQPALLDTAPAEMTEQAFQQAVWQEFSDKRLLATMQELDRQIDQAIEEDDPAAMRRPEEMKERIYNAMQSLDMDEDAREAAGMPPGQIFTPRLSDHDPEQHRELVSLIEQMDEKTMGVFMTRDDFAQAITESEKAAARYQEEPPAHVKQSSLEQHEQLRRENNAIVQEEFSGRASEELLEEMEELDKLINPPETEELAQEPEQATETAGTTETAAVAEPGQSEEKTADTAEPAFENEDGSNSITKTAAGNETNAETQAAPQPETISLEEALRNAHRPLSQAAYQPAVDTEPVEDFQQQPHPQQQPESKPIQQQANPPADADRKLEIPASLTERYLINRERTELMDERTGETQIYINSQKGELSSRNSDYATVEAMLQIAEKNNWQSISVKGTKEFRRLSWEMASMKGLQVDGYRPTKQEQKVMEARREAYLRAQAQNQIRGHAGQPRETAQKEAPRPEVGGETARRQTESNGAAELPGIYYLKMTAGFGAGTVAAIGSKQHPKTTDGQETPFIELQTANGQRHTVWGVALKEIIDQRNLAVGDRVALRVTGTEQVTWTDPKTQQIHTGNRKRWVVDDLVQQPRAAKQAATQAYQPKAKPSANDLATATVKQAAKSQPVTAHRPTEQAKVQTAAQQAQRQSQNKSPGETQAKPER